MGSNNEKIIGNVAAAFEAFRIYFDYQDILTTPEISRMKGISRQPYWG
ncbi:MAG: hypothetical protein AB8U25_00100 [Rickettsiales endosymbiont of Dermacentor nuttalli]